MENIIQVQNITKTYDNKKILDHVSFHIPRGAIYGFIGPNGAGKTTLLRIMAGLLQPDSGDVLYHGISVLDYPEKIMPSLGFMPDTLPGTKSMKVWEYLDFYARASGYTGEKRFERMDAVSGLTQLDSIADKTLFSLSKGMKQRLMLAKVLLHDPEILLLDEPAAGLDPHARQELHQIMTNLITLGKTILISSHILPELEAMVNGAVILEKSRIQFCGSLQELANKPRQTDPTVPVQLGFSSEASSFILPLQNMAGVRSCQLHGTRFIRLELTGSDAEFHLFVKKI